MRSLKTEEAAFGEMRNNKIRPDEDEFIIILRRNPERNSMRGQ